jgi:2,3-bisphosphoglycerate-independent phosphoglycerate mutase
MKTCVVIVDGMNDLPIKQLGGTPLEKAKTYAMDAIASQESGCIKLFDFAPESDEAMMALLDLKPEKNYPGRGILEAYGAGFRLKANAIYFRCNIAKVEGKKIVDFEASIDEKLKKRIERIVNGIDIGLDFEFKFTKGHRAVLIFKDKAKKLSDKVSNTNPAYKTKAGSKLSIALPRPKGKDYFILSSRPLEKTSAAAFTTSKLNEFTEKTLQALRQRGLKFGILVRGASRLGKWSEEIKRIAKKRGFEGWALISEMPVEIAIAKLLGMKIYKYPKSYQKLVELIVELLKRKSVYVQIKGPDAYAHRGDFVGKAKSIEEIDANFLMPLIKKLQEQSIEVELIVSCDHVTSSKHRSHYRGNVTYAKAKLPALLKPKTKFSERLCRKKKKIIKHLPI